MSLRSDRPRVSGPAARFLAARGTAVFEALFPLLADPDWRLRRKARKVFLLLGQGDLRSATAAFLFDRLKKSQSRDLRFQIRRILHDWKIVLPSASRWSVMEILRETSGAPLACWNPLADRFPRPNARAHGVLSRLRELDAAPPTILAPLLTLLRDPLPGLRKNAAFCLGRLGGAEAVAGLGTACQDPDREVRIWAMDALRRLGAKHETAFKALVPLCRDGDPKIRGFCLACLGALDGRLVKTVPLWLHALGDDDRLVAYEAAFQLRRHTTILLRYNPWWDTKLRRRAQKAWRLAWEATVGRRK
jgi:HEAT repeat protein